MKAQIRIVTHPFAPIIDSNSKVLILGSVPSVSRWNKASTICIRAIGFGECCLGLSVKT